MQKIRWIVSVCMWPSVCCVNDYHGRLARLSRAGDSLLARLGPANFGQGDGRRETRLFSGGPASQSRPASVLSGHDVRSDLTLACVSGMIVDTGVSRYLCMSENIRYFLVQKPSSKTWPKIWTNLRAYCLVLTRKWLVMTSPELFQTLAGYFCVCTHKK